jgi:hypothetical protein
VALMIAIENVHVTVAGVTTTVQRGDFYDSAQAIVVASPNSFAALPNGTTVHQLSGAWTPR